MALPQPPVPVAAEQAAISQPVLPPSEAIAPNELDDVVVSDELASGKLTWASCILEYFKPAREALGAQTRKLVLGSGCTGMFTEGLGVKVPPFELHHATTEHYIYMLHELKSKLALYFICFLWRGIGVRTEFVQKICI
jgi:hypothetical protein